MRRASLGGMYGIVWCYECMWSNGGPDEASQGTALAYAGTKPTPLTISFTSRQSNFLPLPLTSISHVCLEALFTYTIVQIYDHFLVTFAHCREDRRSGM